MAAPQTTVLDRLSVLAEPTRSRILLLLDRHELTVGELCTVLQLPQSTVSRHLKLLADDGWLVARGEGTTRFYKMVLEPARRGDPRPVVRRPRASSSNAAVAAQDARRAEGVLAKRRDKAQIFFCNSADAWDKMRTEMIGARTDLLALLDLLDDDVGGRRPRLRRRPHLRSARAVRRSRHRRRRIRPDARRREDAPRERTRTSSCAPARSKRCRSTTRRSTPRCCFSSRTSSPIPAKVMREIRRVLKPGGRLLIVDLMSHDRVEYIVQLGHVWQGFDGDQMKEWLGERGLHDLSIPSAAGRSRSEGPDAVRRVGAESRVDERSALSRFSR